MWLSCIGLDEKRGRGDQNVVGTFDQSDSALAGPDDLQFIDSPRLQRNSWAANLRMRHKSLSSPETRRPIRLCPRASNRQLTSEPVATVYANLR